MKSSLLLPVVRSPHAGLPETLRVLEQRRRWLQGLAAAGAIALLPRGAAACSLIPEETAGPYPGDGSNGPNVLGESGIVRADIRSSFGSAGSATAPGTLLAVTIQLVSTASDCAALAGLAVYVWHCDAQGRYSMYSQGVTTQNFLRGVQVSDADGRVTFTTVYPGCYAGRWPHIHFEVYAALADAGNGANALRTSQIAMPEAASRVVYAQAALYPGSTANLDAVSLASDNVFGDDDGVHQLADVEGDNANGWTAYLEVGVDVERGDAVFADDFDG